MSLRIRLWVYLGVIHIAMAAVLVWQREALGWWLFPIEILLVATFLLGLRLVRLALEPLGFARAFSEVVRSGEYGTRYAPVGHEEIDRVIGTYNLMLSNLQSERLRLGEQRGFLERFLQVTPVGIVIFDFDERVSLANPRALRLLELASDRGPEGRPLAELESPLALSLAALAVGEARMITDASGRRLRCQRAQFQDRGFPRSYVLIEELTAELNRSERATYEKLVRVISHEVTNTVAATNSLLESCLNYADRIGDDEDRVDYQKALNVLIARNRSLNEFTKGFSEVVKLPEPNLQNVDVKEMLESLRTMFKGELDRREIALDVTADGDLPLVCMDRSQIEQVMINVMKNAMEAVSRSGHIELAAVREQGAVAVSVTDDGIGLSEESRQNLFSPFYTSKKRGQGLGLTLVKEILTQHQFAFSLETAGAKTQFRVCIPTRVRSSAARATAR